MTINSFEAAGFVLVMGSCTLLCTGLGVITGMKIQQRKNSKQWKELDEAFKELSNLINKTKFKEDEA
ncbi:MAG: hypothetical protein LBM93_02490 [Oscillospiraceae bacterium]|jgi:hypothetical protein|nr:hypothetical protein [Oscillospiraceae bacterium]